MIPAVSVIVPVYGVEKYLDRCVKSLRNQMLKNIEIILVDDESPDNCPKLCEDYAKEDIRIKVIHKKNGGLGYARNTGIECAQGEYIAYIDSDDYVEENMFFDLYNYAKENKLDTVIAGFNKVLSNGEIVKNIETNKEQIFKGKQELQKFVGGMLGTPAKDSETLKYQMSVWRGIYSRKVIEQNHIRFCSERDYISEDIIYHLDYFDKANSLGILPLAVYNYCENEASLTKTFRKDRFEKNLILYKKIIEKMNLYKYPSEIYEYAMKLFLIRTKSAITSVILNRKNLESGEAKKIVNSIINNSTLKNVLKEYPIKDLPMKRQIFFRALKLRNYNLLLMLVVIYGR